MGECNSWRLMGEGAEHFPMSGWHPVQRMPMQRPLPRRCSSTTRSFVAKGMILPSTIIPSCEASARGAEVGVEGVEGVEVGVQGVEGLEGLEGVEVGLEGFVERGN